MVKEVGIDSKIDQEMIVAKDKELKEELLAMHFPESFYSYLDEFFRTKYAFLSNSSSNNRLDMVMAYDTVHSDLKTFQVTTKYSMSKFHEFEDRLQVGL